RDMHDRRQPALRMVEGVEQASDAIERQVDQLRMQLRQPLEHDVGGNRRWRHRRCLGDASSMSIAMRGWGARYPAAEVAGTTAASVSTNGGPPPLAPSS